MILKEFEKQAQRTFPELKDIYMVKDTNGNFITIDKLYYHKDSESSTILDLLHAKMGICTETDELMDAISKKDSVGVGEELHDKLWYICNDLNTMLKAGYINQYDFDTIMSISFDGTLKATDSPIKSNNLNEWFNAIVYNESKILDQGKKLFAYNKPIDKDEYLKRVKYLIGAINNIAVSIKVDIYEFLDKGIAKLQNRYPNKFTSHNAINRDVEAERIILENNPHLEPETKTFNAIQGGTD